MTNLTELAKRLRAHGEMLAQEAEDKWTERHAADLLAAAEVVERAEKESALLDQLEKLAEENTGGLLIHHQHSPVEWTGVGLGLAHRRLRKAVADTLPAPPEVKP